MNKSPFLISGKERRELKKKASELRSFIKKFWYFHQLDKDMASFYGKSKNFPMSDDEAKLVYDKKSKELGLLEDKLNQPKTIFSSYSE